ncbi:MAG: radical SAM protein [Acidobacteria bacterium]|nr:MAG: radical SAM protein [Acidobacteriota bacterium]
MASEVPTTDGPHSPFVLNLLPHLLSWQDEEAVSVFDGEGRLFSLYQGDCLYRRGLDSSVLCTRRTPAEGRLVRTHRKLDDDEARAVFERASQRARSLEAKVRDRGVPVFAGQPVERLLSRLGQVLAYSPDALFAERERFSRLYKPVSVLPPDQYMALVVQLTHGCPYNQCTFCDLYQDRDYEVKSVDELREWLAQLKQFFGRALGMRKGVFLGDGNCLAMPAGRLLPLLKIVNSEFSGASVLAKGMFSFADTRAILHKSTDQLTSIANAGLKRVYLGLETGSPELLSFLNKPGTPDDQVESVKRLKEAGLQVGVIFMTGIGGHQFAGDHVRKTIDLIQSLPLGSGDLVYLSRFYPIPGTPYAEEVIQGRMDLLSDEEIQDQFARIRSGIVGKGAKIAPYDLAGFVY